MEEGGRFDRPDWDEYFMLQAELAKLRSNCIARKVGAVIVRDRRQIATGYNGTPPGIRNCYEGGCDRCQRRMKGLVASGEDLGRCLCNHAEANAIMHCAILGIEASSASSATLYTTYVPCLECTKMAITIGIRRFVCLEDYTESASQLTREAGVTIQKIDRSRIDRWARQIISDERAEPAPAGGGGAANVAGAGAQNGAGAGGGGGEQIEEVGGDAAKCA